MYIIGPFDSAVVLVGSACLSAGQTVESDVVRCSAGALQTVVLYNKREVNISSVTVSCKRL